MMDKTIHADKTDQGIRMEGEVGGKYLSCVLSSSHVAPVLIFWVQCSGESNRGLTHGAAFCIFVTESSDGSLLAFPTNALFFSSQPHFPTSLGQPSLNFASFKSFLWVDFLQQTYFPAQFSINTNTRDIRIYIWDPNASMILVGILWRSHLKSFGILKNLWADLHKVSHRINPLFFKVNSCSHDTQKT